MTCPRCGAHVEPAALACPYCQTQTEYGRWYAEQQAQAARAQHAAERQSRAEAIRKKGRYAMFCSIAGALTCCFPFALVGIVMGLNAKSAAKRDGLVAPGTSTAAVVFGLCGLALFAGGVALYIHDSRARDARVAALKAQIEQAASSDALDQRLACALVELELLQEGYAGTSGLNIESFQCDGKLERTGDRAALHDVRFRASSSERQSVTACLVRGSRWSVKSLRADGSCDAPTANAAASAR